MESRIRIWSPFVVAYVGGMVTLNYEVRLGDYLGIYNPLFGYMNVEIYAGVLLGVVAAIVSRTWRGALTFVLGLWAMGETAVILGILNGADATATSIMLVPLLVALVFGALGIAAYAFVTAIAHILQGVFSRLAHTNHPLPRR
jgi:hypothetical protein